MDVPEASDPPSRAGEAASKPLCGSSQGFTTFYNPLRLLDILASGGLYSPFLAKLSWTIGEA
jgi:hypothetical protein